MDAYLRDPISYTQDKQLEGSTCWRAQTKHSGLDEGVGCPMRKPNSSQVFDWKLHPGSFVSFVRPCSAKFVSKTALRNWPGTMLCKSVYVLTYPGFETLHMALAFRMYYTVTLPTLVWSLCGRKQQAVESVSSQKLHTYGVSTVISPPIILVLVFPTWIGWGLTLS